MDKNREKKISKSISYWLRHKPEDIGIIINKGGWTDIKKMIEKAAKKGLEFTFEELKEIVKNNDKKRFSISENEMMIRANQGHSIDVEIEFKKFKTMFLYK